MRRLKDLANDFDALALTLPAEVTNNVSVECVEIILVDLLQVTPVDTSKALSNWQVTLDTAATETIDAYYPGKQGSSAAVSREAALAAAKQVLQLKKPGQVVYITNCLPYIQRLNEGWSAQEPAGFVERATLLGRLFTENPASFARV